jgi:hypothetical protein
MAERISHFLRDSGLIKWEPTNSSELTSLFSYSNDLINTIKGMGHNLTPIHDYYAFAELLRDDGSWETAKWELEARIISSLEIVLEKWDEIHEMFTEASECIETLQREGKTREVLMSTADKKRAEKAWAAVDYDLTFLPLDKIITRCPEPALLHILMGLVLLPALLRRRR